MKDIQQLIKKDNQGGRYSNIFPKSYTEAIQSRERQGNFWMLLYKRPFLFLSYNGSEEDKSIDTSNNLILNLVAFGTWK